MRPQLQHGWRDGLPSRQRMPSIQEPTRLPFVRHDAPDWAAPGSSSLHQMVLDLPSSFPQCTGTAAAGCEAASKRSRNSEGASRPSPSASCAATLCCTAACSCASVTPCAVVCASTCSGDVVCLHVYCTLHDHAVTTVFVLSANQATASQGSNLTAAISSLLTRPSPSRSYSLKATAHGMARMSIADLMHC
jgi:hypothetical protein